MGIIAATLAASSSGSSNSPAISSAGIGNDSSSPSEIPSLQISGARAADDPHDTTDGKKVSVLYNATRSLYEQAGFDYLRPKGKRNCVMRMVVP